MGRCPTGCPTLISIIFYVVFFSWDEEYNISLLPVFLLNIACNTAVFKQDFSVIRKSLVERGQQFLQNASLSRDKIARLGCPFVTDGAVCYLQLFVVTSK